ncbi:hypothetical protein Tco_0064957 [Tanacetum coccineum]
MKTTFMKHMECPTDSVCNEAKFKYHWGCKGLGILNLCFADDLMLFCHGDMVSASVLRRALDEFCLSSGLRPHMAKSIVYFGNVPENVKIDIMIAMPFREGSFPIRYLGIPLNANRIVRDDCTILLDKVKKRVEEWRNKSLFFKSEGGLGLKSIHVWNEALMAKYLWSVVINKDSIWILALRNKIRGFVKVKIDRFILSTKVANLVENGMWIWPTDWDTRFKEVLDIPVLTLSKNNDEKVI